MATKLLRKCTSCGKTFKTESSFQSHACVTELEELSLEELMKLYNAKKG